MSSDEEQTYKSVAEACDTEDSEEEMVNEDEIPKPEESTVDCENVSDKFAHESELMKMVFGNKDQLIERLRDDNNSIKSEEKQPVKRKAVWQDEDDERVKVDEGMKSSHVRTYLQDPERQYKQHLSQKFQKLVGEPKWAQLDRDDGSDSDSDSEALRHVGHVITPSKGALMRTNLEYRRRSDLNKLTKSEGPTIKAVEFHPNSSVGLVAGVAGIASLFSVEPKNCDKLHSLCYKSFPITCAKFNKNGKESVQYRVAHTFIYSEHI